MKSYKTSGESNKKATEQHFVVVLLLRSFLSSLSLNFPSFFFISLFDAFVVIFFYSCE